MTKRATPPSTLHDRLKNYIGFTEIQHLVYNLVVLQQQKKFHSLAVLSFMAGEGRSLFTAALAMAYEQTTRSKVLIVDTSTLHQPQSLALRDCFNGSSAVELQSLEDLRRSAGDRKEAIPTAPLNESPSSSESQIIEGRAIQMNPVPWNDFSLIEKVAQDQPQKHGLVLFDTSPLLARNRNNVDPLLVARLAQASVLVVSRSFLDSPRITESLKILNDPQLHLLGIISNEEKDS